MNTPTRTLACILSISLAAFAIACGSDANSSSSAKPLPSPVTVRQEPDGVTLGDPAFEPLEGASADFGTLGGSVYQVEMPDDWNGRLVLFMHGYGELGPETRASAPAIRTSLVLNGYAWGASSFSSTSWIPGRSVEETAALWDLFVQKYGRPEYTYVTGTSMGGAAAHLAAERIDGRFDGSLALCGSSGTTEGLAQQSDFFVAAAYVAGVTQADYDAAADLGALINDRIRPALEDPATHTQFENIMTDLTGGPRSFDREGFLSEEGTNWERSTPLVTAHIAPNNPARYPLGEGSGIPNEVFDRAAIRLSVNEELLDTFLEGYQTTGQLQIPMLTMHTTGDGQVPFYQAQLLRRRVDEAGRSDLLVQRVIRDPGHCGFNRAEWEAGLQALVAWVEHDEKPEGEDVLVDDLRTLKGPFELAPRAGTEEAEALPGAADRVVVRGTLTIDGQPFDADFLGAVVRKDGLTTPCQVNIPIVIDGAYEITVYSDTESAGCGQTDAEVYLWTFTRDQYFYTSQPLPWSGNGVDARFDADFSTADPEGAVPEVTQFFGEAFEEDGTRLPAGSRVEAYIGEALCGVASLRGSGSFGGYVISVAGPDEVPGCDLGATITFNVDGRTARQTRVNGPNGEDRRAPTDLIVQ